MTMKIDIKEQYLDKFEDFINSLPKDAVIVKKSLDDEINQRVDKYKNGTMKKKGYRHHFSTNYSLIISSINSSKIASLMDSISDLS